MKIRLGNPSLIFKKRVRCYSAHWLADEKSHGKIRTHLCCCHEPHSGCKPDRDLAGFCACPPWRVSYVIVNGISMEPAYHLGDLTIMRKAAAYQVGDVVTYHDAEMNAYVIHRIIGVDQDQYVLQGDNNSWIDAYRPTKPRQHAHEPQRHRGPSFGERSAR